ncbi:MAG: hypothetical protein ACJASX_003303 [Limisphaerales bacterium]|jgi:hypothetical protein
MKKRIYPVVATLFAFGIGAGIHAEAAEEATAFLTRKGIAIHKDRAGAPNRVMSAGKTPLSASDYQRIGELKTIESLGLNAATLKDSEWEFLKSLPKLKRLSIWHAKGISSLSGFSGLGVESLTVGGSMGLRDNNRARPERHLNAVLTLRDLPNLHRLSLYHTPLTPDDSHLAHIAKEFPKLNDLRLDFATPRGVELNISIAGLRKLHALPLVKLTVENIQAFTAAHMQTIAEIPTLKTLVIDARKRPVSKLLVDAARTARPGLKIDLQQAKNQKTQ